ncbi:Protocadherin-9 [Branchiostoma belcheri]|nr:Protocadherin-9 [Branchiostoma belcheri]
MPPPPCNVLSRCTQDRLNSPVRNSPEKAKILKIKDFNNPSSGNGRKVTFVDQRPDSPVSYDGSHHSSPTNSSKGLNLKNSPSHVAAASYRNSPVKTVGKSLYEDSNRNAAYNSPNRNAFVDNNVAQRTPYEDSNKNSYSPHHADPRFTGYEGVKPNRKPLCLRTFDPNREFKGTTLGDSSTSSEEGNELYNMEDVSEVLDNVEGTPPDSPYGESPYKPKELARELDELTFSSFRV